MRFGIIACVHSNLPALEAVLQDARAVQCENMLCLGDIVGYYDYPKECLNLVRTHCHAAVKGNHDEYCSGPVAPSGYQTQVAAVMEWTRNELSFEEKNWLSELPYTRNLADFTLVHATLEGPERWGYIFDRLAAASHFLHQELPVCFNGHTHVPFVYQSKEGKVTGGTFSTFSIEPGTKYLVNVGSVGQSREGRTDAAYVVFDAEERTVELRRVNYPRPSGGAGVRKPAPGRGGPPTPLKAYADTQNDDKTDS